MNNSLNMVQEVRVLHFILNKCSASLKLQHREGNNVFIDIIAEQDIARLCVSLIIKNLPEFTNHLDNVIHNYGLKNFTIKVVDDGIMLYEEDQKITLRLL